VSEHLQKESPHLSVEADLFGLVPLRFIVVIERLIRVGVVVHNLTADPAEWVVVVLMDRAVLADRLSFGFIAADTVIKFSHFSHPP
jgi:hypothetical protein